MMFGQVLSEMMQKKLKYKPMEGEPAAAEM